MLQILFAVWYLLIACVSPSSALQIFDEGAVIRSGAAAGADYAPATVHVRQGNGNGTTFTLAIYSRSGGDSGTLITNGVSNNLTVNGGAVTTVNGTFTSCAALTPGASYIVTINCQGTSIFFAYSGTSDQWGRQSGTSHPATLAGAYYLKATGFVEFQIKNAGGQVLLSHGDMTSTTTTSLGTGYVWYERVATVCATL
jgi:hypothetical protein